MEDLYSLDEIDETLKEIRETINYFMESLM
jgi:hypothetical protein